MKTGMLENQVTPLFFFLITALQIQISCRIFSMNQQRRITETHTRHVVRVHGLMGSCAVGTDKTWSQVVFESQIPRTPQHSANRIKRVATFLYFPV